ncbi:hypothetical protein [Silvanigrella aquatica]|uniref:Uncharacterized protein n=1 Tax=Silvanigrella aquatica TaxID=1915309 RepID=A0A1L4D2M6_9BACT|nr:hypothetical protein [Silvanigrella aquatica]APJ04453.1 hypothetical protein AXG55_11250 [Silvanigrella aquatica]
MILNVFLYHISANAVPAPQKEYDIDYWKKIIGKIKAEEVNRWCENNLSPSKKADNGRDIEIVKKLATNKKYKYIWDQNTLQVFNKNVPFFYLYQGESDGGVKAFLKWRINGNQYPKDIGEVDWKVINKINLNKIENSGGRDLFPNYGHFGDYKQANFYGNSNYMLRIRLNKEILDLLFTPELLALTSKSINGFDSFGCLIPYVHKDKDVNAIWNRAENSQGWLNGYIGLNTELKEPYSFAVAKAAPSRFLLQMIASRLELVFRDTGEPFKDGRNAEHIAYLEYVDKLRENN